MTDGGNHIECSFALAAPAGEGTVSLPEILLLCLCAVLGGADSWVEVIASASWDFCAAFSRSRMGCSHDQLGNVFAAGRAELFHRGGAVYDRSAGQDVAPFAAAKQGPIHLGVEFTAAGAGAARWRTSRRDHAIPELLQLLELHGAVVTIDAMGCQRTRGADHRPESGLCTWPERKSGDAALGSTNGRMVMRGTESPCMRVLTTGAWKRAVWLRPDLACGRTTNGRACAA